MMCAPWLALLNNKTATGPQKETLVEKKEECEKETFLRAAEKGDVGKVAWLLNSKPGLLNAMTRKDPGRTPLIVAASKNNLEVVRLLLMRGAKTEMADRQGWTALLHACDHGYKDVLSSLLESGADMTVRSKWGSNGLMMAAEKGHADCVKTLLLHAKKGYNVNLVDNNLRTALWKACAKGHKEVARVLILDGNADPSIPARSGCTAAQIAKQNGHNEVAELLTWWDEQQSRLKERCWLIQRTASTSIQRSVSSASSLPVIRENEEVNMWEDLNEDEMKDAE